MKRKGAVDVDLRRFLSHCSILFGFVATLWLSRVLWAGPEEMLQSSFNYSPGGWPSIEITCEKASQKADTLTSILLAALAALLHLSTIRGRNDMPPAEPRAWRLPIAAALLVGVVTLIAWEINIAAAMTFDKSIRITAAKRYLKDHLEEFGHLDHSSVDAIAEQYFRLKRKTDETNEEFFRRLASHVGYDPPVTGGSVK